jgi:hypothetical protein
MRPAPGEVLHFSENPAITRFEPHVAATARETEAYVWAVDSERAPDYWFPRECPRAMAWATPTTTERDRERIIGAGGGTRVHAIEYRWLDAMRAAQLFAYRFNAAQFRPRDPADPNAFVSTEAVEPLGPPEPVGDLLALHEAAGIQLRMLDNLWPWWNEVIASTLGFSGIRLRNAKPPHA